MDPNWQTGGAPPGGAPSGGAGAPNGTGGPPGGFAGPPNPNFIPAPPSELAKSIAYAFVGVGVTLNIISFIVFSGRVYTRTIPAIRLAWDDYTIALAYLMVLIHSIFLFLSVPWAFPGNISPLDFKLQGVINGNKYALISQPLWAWSMALIKTSVAIMLLRLEPAKNMRLFLWAMIAFQICVAIYNTTVQALQCIPFEAAWDLLELIQDAKCMSREDIGKHQIVIACANVVTDVVFALLPISFLRKVQRPLRERVIIGCLMGLGLFAAVASCMKAVAAAEFGKGEDKNAEGITIGTWSMVEEQVAFIAACIPCLRAMFQSLMVKLGVATTHDKTKATGYPKMKSDTRKGTGRMGSNGGIRLKSLDGGELESDEDGLVQDSNGRIWRTTELRMEEVRGQEMGNGRIIAGRDRGMA